MTVPLQLQGHLRQAAPYSLGSTIETWKIYAHDGRLPWALEVIPELT